MMEYITGTIDFHIEGPCAVSAGKFDGIHKGHMLLMDAILKQKENGLKTVIFTFDFGAQKRLMPMDEQRSCFEQMGIDVLIQCPFDERLSHMEAEEFVRKILIDRIDMKYMAVGTDFCFGYQRKGNHELLRKMAGECGYEIDVFDKASFEGRDISSTFVREVLERGHMELAETLLGYPYTVYGTVAHGRALGRTWGMPTINIYPSKEKILPPKGVYASMTTIEGVSYPGITNIGIRPTVSNTEQVSVETYLFDVDMDLYDKEAAVALIAFERPEQRFSSEEMLKQRIQMDIDWGKIRLSD